MILSRPRLLPQQRFDLEDLEALLSAGRTDAKLYTKEFLAVANYVMRGFNVSGIGLKQATVVMADATLIMPANTFDFSWFIAEPGAPNATIPEASFTPGVRNYVEIELIEENNTSLTRAFWDPQANSGAGAEFNQIVDTITDLACSFVVLTGGFSGSPNSVKLAIVDVDGSGNIKTILDRRDMFRRLGRTSNIKFSYSWGTRQEPPYSMTLSGVSGTFIAGEQITINTETALVVTGGISSISFNEPTGINFFPGSTVTGGTSGATGTVDTILESFTGVDKSILNDKDQFDALASEIKLVKGTTYWWENPASSISGVAGLIDSFLVQAVHGASWSWDGTNLSITDNNLLPSSGDVLGFIRLFGSAQQIGLQRQDGTGGSTVIPIPDGSVLFVKLPAVGDRNYSGVGAGVANYQVVPIASYVPSDNTYWIAYRDLNALYVRDYGELDPGESTPISDPDKETILAMINANQNKSDQDRLLKLVRGGTWHWDSDTNTLSWSADAAIQVPGLTESRNNILAGSVVLATDGQVAYVEINRAGAPAANLTVSVASINALAYTDNTVIIARKFGGATSVIAQQLVHTAGDALNTTNSQLIGNPFVVSGPNTITNIEVKLTRVGSPSGSITVSLQGDTAGNPNGIALESTTVLASSIAANPGETSINLMTAVPVVAGTYHIVISSDVTYKASFGLSDFISAKRDSATSTPPLEERNNGSTWSHDVVGALYYVVNSGGGMNEVVVGNHSFALRGGESSTLDGAVPLINDFFNQLKLRAANPSSTRIIISSPDVTMLTGEKRSQSIVGLLLAMDGAQIDFQTGNIYKADGTTARGINFSPIVPATGMYRWFSIGVIPSTTNADNTIDGQILVLPASADGASAAAAPKAAFSSGIINLGQVVLYSTNGTTVSAIPQSSIIQLGVGSGSGSGSGAAKVDLYDPISTTLPSGPTATIDGVAVVNGYVVLFSNLSASNNRAYKASGVGTSITWAAQPIFGTPYDPVNGDQVIIKLGSAFSDQTSMFDGTTFNINKVVRHFTSANYWQEESLQEGTLLNNTTGNIFSVTALGSENIIVDFSIKRNGIKETGTLWLTNDATNAFVTSGSTYSGVTGVVFSADINAGNVRLRYTTTNTGFDAQFKYNVKRWSDATGGPSGPVSYSPSLLRYDNAAFVMSDNSGTPVNCNPTTNVLGKTRVQLSFTYVTGLMSGTTVGDLEVYANGQKCPRFVAGATLDMYYKEISNNTVEFYTDLQVTPINIEIVKRV